MITPDENTDDYVTILDTIPPSTKKVVVIMHYHKDEWIQTKCSFTLKPAQAVHLAESWAAARCLEIR